MIYYYTGRECTIGHGWHGPAKQGEYFITAAAADTPAYLCWDRTWLMGYQADFFKYKEVATFPTKEAAIAFLGPPRTYQELQKTKAEGW